MRHAVIVSLVVLGVLCTSSHLPGQTVEGFVTGGLHRDVNREQFIGAGGGLLLTTARWLSFGAQGDAFFSPPYVAGRFTILVQGNVLNIGGMRPFVQAGTSLGELKGSMYGAGVDFYPRNARVGLRATLQTYVTDLWPDQKAIQPSMNVGIIWRAQKTAD